MKEITSWAILSGASFILFLVFLLLTVIRKNKNLLFPSFLFFICFLIFIGLTGYSFIRKAYPRVEKMIKPRSGMEIYVSLFGTPANHCLRIRNFQDQVIPKIDTSILLEAETCPKEIERILELHHYTVESFSTSRWSENPDSDQSPSWFSPTKFGEQVWMYTYTTDEGKHNQTIWLSRDSTKMLIRDLFD